MSVQDFEVPEWLQFVKIDIEELGREIDCMMYQEEIEDHQRIIQSFVSKVNLDSNQRMT